MKLIMIKDQDILAKKRKKQKPTTLKTWTTEPPTLKFFNIAIVL